MAVVVDANVLLVLTCDDARAPIAESLMSAWLESGEELHAPGLAHYEVTNGLTRLAARNLLRRHAADDAMRAILDLPITYHRPSQYDGRVIDIALLLRRVSAYDAFYIALAESLAAEMWTFDGKLARNAAGNRLPVTLAQ